MKIPFSIIFRELKGNKRFILLFILNLGIGLTGFIALNTFRESIDHTLNVQSKNILGADFGISARRPILSSEKEAVNSYLSKDVVENEMVEMFTMVAGNRNLSRLVQLKAISYPYPFYGELKLEHKGIIDGSKIDDIYKKREVWIYPELLLQLGKKVGEKLKIGEVEFTISDIVNEDSAAGFSTTMAPRVYLSLQHLQDTKLLRKGSMAWYSYVYKIPNSTLNTLEKLHEDIFEKVESNDLKVYTYSSVNEQTSRLMNYLGDFLGLASLAALFLAAIGSGFLYRSFLRERLNQMAVLLSLGLSKSQAFSLYIVQLMVLGALSAALAVGLSILFTPLINYSVQGIFPYDISIILSVKTISMAFVLGCIGSILICLPQLVIINKLRPARLLTFMGDEVAPFSFSNYLTYIPGIILFWGLSVYQAHSLIIGSLFFVVFLIASLLLAILSPIIFYFLERLAKNLPKEISWAMRDLSRHRLATTSTFLAFGLGMLLLNFIPQIETSLQRELSGSEKSKLPSLFLFDIQEEQVEDLKKIAKAEFGGLKNLSPMVRSKLIEVNDKPFEKGSITDKAKTREEQRARRFRNRGMNLSYRDGVGVGETIIEGRAFSGSFKDDGSLPEISLEMRFADRLGLKLGDKLTFDIQSLPISGRVINIRRVKWTTFSPNFFIQFQPLEKKNDFQVKVIEKLPNISMVDVSRLALKLQDIIQKMGQALNLMAYLCIALGFLVIFSISFQQSQKKLWDVALYKVLGTSFKSIRSVFLWQFGVVSILASFGGAAFAILISILMTQIIFNTFYAVNWQLPLISSVLCCILSLIITTYSTLSALRTRPIVLLN